MMRNAGLRFKTERLRIFTRALITTDRDPNTAPAGTFRNEHRVNANKQKAPTPEKSLLT
jgi:hypothetical protein